MGNVCGWLAQFMFPEEQAIWHAAHNGDGRGIREAVAKMTPDTRRYLEWQDTCSGRTPLAEAAATGHTDCVVALLAAGANGNAKDYKGNSPLHLACRHGRVNVVRCLLQVPSVLPFDVNAAVMTPLDLVRDRLARHEGPEDSGTKVTAYEQCIEELEKRFYVHSGWLYEKTENLLSMVSGISSLHSWKHRFCIVLQRGIPDVLELALFSMKPGQARPACPSTVVFYHVRGGLRETTDSKWFNRKEYAFKVTGSIRRHTGTNDRVSSAQELEFAAVDSTGLVAWNSFFTHQQELLAASGYHGPAYSRSHAPCGGNVASSSRSSGGPRFNFPDCTSSSFSSTDTRLAGRSISTGSTTTTGTNHSLDQDDADLQRALELSLLTCRPSTTSGLTLETSAPSWTEDEETEGSAQEVATFSSDDCNSFARSGKSETSAPPPSFTKTPCYSPIGECVVCFDGPQVAVCVPCGHNAVCMACAEELLDSTRECPVCRQPIREIIKLYRV